VSFGPELFQHDLQLAGLRRLGLEAELKLSASTTDALLGLVAAGLGYSLIPWPSLYRPQVPDVHALRLGTKQNGFTIHAAYREGRADDPLLVAVLHAMPRLRTASSSVRSSSSRVAERR
jgi:DNA-binding transcriptional LysR family regulator